MNTSQMLKALLDGHKVKRLCAWTKLYIELKDNKIIDNYGILFEETFKTHDEWDIYIHKVNMVDALDALFAGKKIRRDSWCNTSYIYIDYKSENPRMLNQDNIEDFLVVADNKKEWIILE